MHPNRIDRRKLLQNFWSALPAAYCRSIQPSADPAVRRLLNSLLKNPGDLAVRHEIAERMLSVARRAALRLFQRLHWAPDANLDDAVQEGAIGLIGAIDAYVQRVGVADPDRFVGYCFRAATRAIRPGLGRGKFGGGVDEKRLILGRLRTRFVCHHGRLPNRREMTEQLRVVFSNPDIQVGDANAPSRVHRRTMTGFSDDPFIQSEAEEIAISSEVDRPLIDAETLRLAMRGLDADQRRILESALAGDSLKDIARMLGVSKSAAGNRVNAVLWQVRKRADLAEYLGVELVETPAPARLAG